jgi:hypothetical protein
MVINGLRERHSWFEITHLGQNVGYAKHTDRLRRNRLETFQTVVHWRGGRWQQIHLAAELVRRRREWLLVSYRVSHHDGGFTWAELRDGRLVLEYRGVRSNRPIPEDATIRPLVRILAVYSSRRQSRDEIPFTLLATGDDRLLGPASLVRITAEAGSPRQFSAITRYNLLLGEELLETLVVGRDGLLQIQREDGYCLEITDAARALAGIPSEARSVPDSLRALAEHGLPGEPARTNPPRGSGLRPRGR